MNKKIGLIFLIIGIILFSGGIVFAGYCPWCGADVPEGAKFCPDCGKELSIKDFEKETGPRKTEYTCHENQTITGYLSGPGESVSWIINFWCSDNVANTIRVWFTKFPKDQGFRFKVHNVYTLFFKEKERILDYSLDNDLKGKEFKFRTVGGFDSKKNTSIPNTFTIYSTSGSGEFEVYFRGFGLDREVVYSGDCTYNHTKCCPGTGE